MSTGLRYLAYMLRLWQVQDDEAPCWRASLEDPHTGERRVFANLEALSTHLRAEMDAAVAPVPGPTGTPKPGEVLSLSEIQRAAEEANVVVYSVAPLDMIGEQENGQPN
jgi:hypothetical protein